MFKYYQGFVSVQKEHSKKLEVSKQLRTEKEAIDFCLEKMENSNWIWADVEEVTRSGYQETWVMRNDLYYSPKI